jgi:hypothetical protein
MNIGTNLSPLATFKENDPLSEVAELELDFRSVNSVQQLIGLMLTLYHRFEVKDIKAWSLWLGDSYNLIGLKVLNLYFICVINDYIDEVVVCLTY